jgi:copper/silver efflux system protein
MVGASPVTAGSGAIGRIIGSCARNPLFTLLTVAAFAAWGYYSLRSIPLDAIPDLSDVQVIVFTEWPGQSPDLVEDQLTYPISSSLLAAPKVRYVRGQSFLGLSFVTVIFEDGTDLYWARSRVLEYLNSIAGRLPAGVTPQLGPDATGVGWVFQYALIDRTGRHDLAELRSLQDWRLRYWLESVEGVAEVAPVGGLVRQYQVTLDPNKLLGQGIPLRDVVEAIRRSNADVGGRVIEIAGHEQMIRGRGYIRGTADLEEIPLKIGTSGTPVRLRDVGTVQLGPDMRRGIAELNGEGEAVGGIIVMRFGENALNVIEAVKRRLKEVETSLPEGVEIVVTYDRSELILAAIRTLRRTLIEEMIVVSLVMLVFLLHARSAFVLIVMLPTAVMLAFIPMFQQKLTANIMSLGGIAVAIGAMVDAGVIIVENIHKRLERWEGEGRPGDRTTVLIDAMQEVGPAIFFSLLVITVSFLPVFTLEATEGRLFRPLAFTKTYSMGFAAILAITMVPALAVLLIRGRILTEEHNPVNRLLIRAYSPVVRSVVRHRWLVMVLAVLSFAFTVPAFLRLGGEFMPPLNEGVLLYMPTAPPSMSATDAAALLHAMDRRLMQFPEVERVFGKIGRAETATDPAPMSMVETVVLFKPREEWREGLTWDGLMDEITREMPYPGMQQFLWMPIQTRTEMLASGIRAPLGVKVFGPDLATIERVGIEIERALLADPRTRPHTRSAYADRLTGGFYLDFVVDRVEAARHGLTVGDVNEVILAAVGGATVTETIEGRERYPVNVRYARDFRETPGALGRVLIATPTGAQIPISQVARIEFVSGPPMIGSEDGQLVGYVSVDVSGRPLADYAADAQRVVGEAVEVPPGVRIAWAGQFQYLRRAQERLKLIVPLTLFLVFVLLYLNTRSVVEVCIVLLAVPFSLIGAIWLLYLLDFNMSVAVWVGMIALMGIDAEMGVVMLLYLKLAYRRHVESGSMKTAADLEAAIVEGAAQRIRPKLMTVLTTFIGLMPLMWSHGAGADVMQRIAAPMIGGLVSSFLLELTVYPAIFAVWKGRGLLREGSG